MKKNIAVFFAALLAAAVPAGAEEWNTMGPRAMGMGGAGVALAQGPLASYWNPAALGLASENSYGFVLPISVHAALTGSAVAGANDLMNTYTNCKANPTLACIGEAQYAVNELSNPTNGLRVDGSVGGDFKVGPIAFFSNAFLDAGAAPRVDTVNINPFPGLNNIASNTSALIVKGARILEFGAGYGREIPYVPGLFLGGNLKVMSAEVGYVDYLVLQNNDHSSNVLGALKDDTATSANVGLDAGALWDVDRTFQDVWWRPRVGLTGRNLNNPKFSQPGSAAADGAGGSYAVNPQARLGLAISPLHWWNFAADVDLTRNLTPVNGVASRQLDLGTEINVFNRSWIDIPLRVGFARNVENATNMFTAGAGVNLLHLMIDISGEVSPTTVQTQNQGGSTKIPEELGASVSLSILFGGSEDRPSHAKSSDDYSPPQAAAPAQADQIRAHAAGAQQEMDQVKPQPMGN
ncbi:MAG: conjugal transfer protein TraF [Elusimicrobiota bacterium]